MPKKQIKEKNLKHDWDGRYGKDELKDLYYWCIYCGRKLPLEELDYKERENCPARIKKVALKK